MHWHCGAGHSWKMFKKMFITIVVIIFISPEVGTIPQSLRNNTFGLMVLIPIVIIIFIIIVISTVGEVRHNFFFLFRISSAGQRSADVSSPSVGRLSQQNLPIYR